jgi:hypothetical protein
VRPILTWFGRAHSKRRASHRRLFVGACLLLAALLATVCYWRTPMFMEWGFVDGIPWRWRAYIQDAQGTFLLFDERLNTAALLDDTYSSVYTDRQYASTTISSTGRDTWVIPRTSNTLMLLRRGGTIVRIAIHRGFVHGLRARLRPRYHVTSAYVFESILACCRPEERASLEQVLGSPTPATIPAPAGSLAVPAAVTTRDAATTSSADTPSAGRESNAER